jgi:hypothetical protein
MNIVERLKKFTGRNAYTCARSEANYAHLILNYIYNELNTGGK